MNIQYTAHGPAPEGLPSASGGRRRLLVVGGSLAIGLLAGCAGLPPANLIPPTLTFRDFSLESLSLSEVVFSLSLMADNPNTIDLPINDLDFQLRLMGSAFADGRARDRAIRLPAGGQGPVIVRFVVPLGRFLRLLRELPQVPLAQISYELTGQARWGDSGVMVPFNRKDSLESLQELQDLFRAFRPPEAGANAR